MKKFIIQNAYVIDGSGTPAFPADVLIEDGTIKAIGKQDPQQAGMVIDAHGLTLAPGFINSHSHGDMMADLDDTFFQEAEQGVTTLIAGMCGISAAPFSMEHLESCLETAATVVHYDFSSSATKRVSYAGYLDMMDRPLGTNMAVCVGHGTLRAAVMGMADREPDPAELERMKAILQECMEAGALGISYGLQYPAGCYAGSSELAVLSSVAARFGGITSAHIRSEGDQLVESVTEMVQATAQSNCTLVISHHKAINRPNWGKTAATISLMQEVNQQGHSVYCDVYPYTASSTGLKSRIPQSMHVLGEEKLLQMLSDPSGRRKMRDAILAGMMPEERFGTTMFGASVTHPDYTGQMVCDLASRLDLDPCELVMDVLYDDRLTTNGIYHCMQDEDVNRVLQFSHSMIGSDGLYYKGCSGAHPRAFGTFTRVLGHYVREKNVLSLEEAVRKMTSLPASVYQLKGKGLIRPGMDADLVLFDPHTVSDQADFTDFSKRGTGIELVWIRGEKIVEHGIYNGVKAGKLIRHVPHIS